MAADSPLTTASTNYDKTIITGIQRRIEEEMRPGLIHLQDCVPGEYGAGVGPTIRFLAYRDAAVTTGTPSPGTAPWLTEGTAPALEQLDIDYEEMTAYQAGRIWGITDKAALHSPHDLLAIYAERAARNVAATIDQYIADVVAADTQQVSAIFSGSSNTQTSDVAAGDIITGYNVKQAVAALASASVPRFPDGYYHAWIHPQVSMLGLMVDNDAGGWIDANKYTDARPLLNGELGRYAGVRFIESAQCHIRAGSGTGSVDIYDTVVYGPGAFGFGDVASIQAAFVRGPDKSDPLNQIVAKIGWKAYFGAIVLSAAGARYARIQSAGV